MAGDNLSTRGRGWLRRVVSAAVVTVLAQFAMLVASPGLQGPVVAQTLERERFQRLLREYKQDPARGVAQVIALRDGEIDRFLVLCRGTQTQTRFSEPGAASAGNGPAGCTRWDFLTTAQLLLDAAVEIIGSDYNRSARFIGHGGSVLRTLHADYPDLTPLESQFIPLWYSHASRALLSQHFLDRAARLLADVFPWFPESAELYVTRGLIAEIPVGWLASNLRGEKPTVIDDSAAPFQFYVPPAGPNQGPAAAAAHQYRRALALDPTSVRAYLRLAWVHVRERDGRAVENATRALHYALNDDERYLAELLLGAAAETKGRYEDAINAYARARAFGPHYQAACTGLANAYAVLGNALAVTTAMQCMSLKSSTTQPDPWLVLRYGIPEPAIGDWLHREARRP